VHCKWSNGTRRKKGQTYCKKGHCKACSVMDTNGVKAVVKQRSKVLVIGSCYTSQCVCVASYFGARLRNLKATSLRVLSSRQRDCV
jgi:hypothetical protein